MESPPHNVRMLRVSSADASRLAARDLSEALQKPTPNAPSATINDTHHKALRILLELFNIVPKAAEQQLTNRNY